MKKAKLKSCVWYVLAVVVVEMVLDAVVVVKMFDAVALAKGFDVVVPAMENETVQIRFLLKRRALRYLPDTFAVSTYFFHATIESKKDPLRVRWVQYTGSRNKSHIVNSVALEVSSSSHRWFHIERRIALRLVLLGVLAPHVGASTHLRS